MNTPTGTTALPAHAASLGPSPAEPAVRDVVALAMLPSVWAGADPHRIGESLAAALATLLNPEVVCVCLSAGPGAEPVVVELAHTGPVDESVAARIRAACPRWLEAHDPDEAMLIERPAGPALRVAVRPIGAGAEMGFIAAAFADPARPSRADHTLLNIAAVQAAATLRSTLLIRQVRRGEDRYRAIVEAQSEMVCRFRPDGTILFVNGGYARARGTTPDALVGVNFWSFIPEGEHARVREMLEALSPEAPEASVENVYQTADGPRWTLWTNRALTFDSAGRATEVQSAGIDITHRRLAEIALRTSEARANQLIKSLPAAVYTCDAQGRVTMFNDAAAALWQRRPKLGEELWCGSWRIFHPDGSPMPLDECPMAVALKTGQAVRGREILVERPDGSQRSVLPHPEPILGPGGEILGAVNTLIDITDRKHAELRDRFLVTLDDRLRPLTDPGAITAAAADLLREHLGVNRCAYAEVGPDQDTFELVGDSCDGVPSIVGRYRFTDFGDACYRLMRAGAPFSVEDSEADPRCAGVVAAYRGTHIRSVVCVPLHKAGRLAAAMAVHATTPRQWREDEVDLVRTVASRCWESIERARAQRDLRQSERRFRTMADTAPAILWVAEPDGSCSFISRGWSEYTGQPEAKALGFGWLDAVHPDDRDAVRRELLAAVADRQAFSMAHRLRRADGQHRWVLNTARPRLDQRSGYAGHIGSVFDIHERKEAEDRAAAAAQRLKLVADAMPALISYVDADQRYQFNNKAYADWFGPDRADLRGLLLQDVVGPDAYRALLPHVQAALAGRRASFETEIPYAHAGTRLVFGEYVPDVRPDGSVAGFYALITDVTQRRQHEQARARLAAIVESSNDAIISKSLAGVIETWNEGARRIFGYTADEAIGRPITILIPDDRRDEEARIIASICAGQRVDHYETVRRRKDGSLVDVSLTVSPILDANARVVGASKIARDITQRRQAEQELARSRELLEQRVEERTRELAASHERLRMSERMASLGTLSAGLGHDMGNLLVPVRVCVEALEQADLPADLAASVAEIKTSAQYLQQLANGLRLMAIEPERAHVPAPTNLARWWADAQPVMKTALPRAVALQADFPDDCWASIAKAALTQAVFNLVQNAGAAMRDRGSGTVRVAARPHADRVLLTVEDDGPGMSPEVRVRCMEPFFTTKTRGISTGLGLVLVAGLVRDAGGSVDLWSEPGKGTRFTLDLALAAPEAAQTPPGAGKRAAVRLADARLRAFVTAELKAMAFQVVDDETHNAPIDLAVVQPDQRSALDGRAGRIVVVGEAGPHAPSGLPALSRPSAIKETLQAAAREARGEGTEQ